MKNAGINFVVGLFVILGVGVLMYMSIRIGGANLSGDNQYTLIARFANSSGLKEGAFIEAAGVRVGQTASIRFDPETYESVVELVIDKSVQVPDDSIAAIRTAGIIGDRFVKIIPGGSDLYLENGEEFLETESSISLEELVSKYMFNEE